MVQVIACYHPDLSCCHDVVDLQGGGKEVGSWGQVWGKSMVNSIKDKTAYQTDVGVNAHLDVFPVKFNASGSHPERNAAEEGKGRDSLVP